MRNGRFEGFTLVEMIATLIIIALIAAVTAPLFSNVNVFKQSGFYEETLSAIRYAQKHAVANSELSVPIWSKCPCIAISFA